MRTVARLLIALVLCAASAPAGAATLRELVPGAVAFHNDVSAAALAEPGPRQVEALIAGETVVIRRRARSENGLELQRVDAYALSTRPFLHLWLAATRGAPDDGGALTTIGVERHPDGRSTTFGHLDLPWPLDDRWWLTALQVDVALAEASGGRVWARRWRLVDNAAERATTLARDGRIEPFTVECLAAARPLPVNEGAFLVFDLDGHQRLLAWSTAVAAGGAIPDDFFAALAGRILRGTVERVMSEADDVPDRYVDGASVQVDGFGRPVPHFPGALARGHATPESP